MGVETIAAVMTIASAVKSMTDQPKSPKAKKMPYQEAYNQAGAQLNPLYDKRMTDVLNNVQGDLINRGFAGQQAGTELSTETAAENERQRTAALAGLAQSIQQGYNDQSYRDAALKYQADWAKHQAQVDTLNNMGSWLYDKTYTEKTTPTTTTTNTAVNNRLPKQQYNYRYA